MEDPIWLQQNFQKVSFDKTNERVEKTSSLDTKSLPLNHFKDEVIY
jgi:hypothetical protein